MIYNSDYFKEELKKSYLDGSANRRRLLIVCALVSLFCIALNGILNLLNGTVVAEIIPAICNRSFYSVAQLLNFFMLIFFVFYIAQKYNAATFAEINKNRWYMLIKMGYKPHKIIFIKHITTIIMVVVLYSVSFLTAFIVSSLLRYPLLISSLPAMYLTGLLQTLFLVAFIMTVSLFVKRAGVSILCSLAAAAFMAMIGVLTGFFDTTGSSVGMTLGNLFTGASSVYIYHLIGLTSAFIAVSVVIAVNKSKYYNTRGGKIDNVYVLDYKTDKAKKVAGNDGKRVKKIIKITVTSVFSCALILGIVANVFLVIMGAASQNREFTVAGHTPFVFGSSTMSGDVEKNDFVVFEKPDASNEYSVGDVVLYYENNSSVIKKVTAVDGGELTLDISSYPSGLEAGSQISVVKSDRISGVLAFKSRWLGAWFVLNNSVGGRIIMLGIPLLILAFYDNIVKTLGFLKSHLGLAEE